MPVTLLSNNTIVRLDLGGQGKTTADVLLYGATVTSWKKKGQEMLFLSDKAALDGSAAVRGGIPIIFPLFGAKEDHDDAEGLERVGRHGFARNTVWSLKPAERDSDNAREVSAVFVLSSQGNSAITSTYSWPFELAYKVTLSDSLTCELSITHLSTPTGPSAPMRFHALLHNYLRVPNSAKAVVRGLQGLTYLDKVLGRGVEAEQTEQDVAPLGKPMDRVYVTRTKTGTVPIHNPLQLLWTGSPSQTGLPDLGVIKAHLVSGRGLELYRSNTLVDTTVWNPAPEGAEGLKDMQAGGWTEFVCVEPGAVSRPVELGKGETWVAKQTLQSI